MKITVLLIESGGSGNHISDIPYIGPDLVPTVFTRTYNSTVQKSGVCMGKPCQLDVGHVLGGGSTHNWLMYVRGS